MRAHHARAAKVLNAHTEPGGEFWGWAGRTLGAPARTVAGEPACLRLVAAPADKAPGKLWDGAVDAQHAFGDLDGHRPAPLAVHDAVDDGTAYPAELSVRVMSRYCPTPRSSSCLAGRPRRDAGEGVGRQVRGAGRVRRRGQWQGRRERAWPG